MSGSHRSDGGPDPEPRRDGRRQTLVTDELGEVLAARTAETGRAALDIVDAGGGTGGFAVPFAALGHNVTVVDPSPDALAGARRRAAEWNVRLTAVQGDADDLDALVGAGSADLVICHSVLEYVDSPARAMAAIARVLRPGATVSVLAANAIAAVLQRALAGRYAEAQELLSAADADGNTAGGTTMGGTTAGGRPSGRHPARDGRYSTPERGAGSPGEPRRFTLAGLTALITDAGLRPSGAHGIRVFSGLLSAADADPGAAEALLALEDAAATYPALREIAARLHITGVSAPDPGTPDPGTPDPGTPGPGTSGPETPDAQTPGPEAPPGTQRLSGGQPPEPRGG
jgi:SAM-dependent methyltransferase